MSHYRTIEIINKLGMHARAAAKFVHLASSLSSKIEVESNSQRVNGKSIMGLLMLAASRGTQITIHADGEDAVSGLDKLEALINNRFDEVE